MKMEGYIYAYIEAIHRNSRVEVRVFDYVFQT